jgi:predicted methyltransferase
MRSLLHSTRHRVPSLGKRHVTEPRCAGFVFVVAFTTIVGCGAALAAPSTPAPSAQSTPADAQAIAAAIANPARPQDDVARDADRKPAQTLEFYGVKPGEHVFEFVGGGGYFTELLSRTVGPNGSVAVSRLQPARIADNRLPNVTAVPDNEWGLAPNSVDLAFTALNYHDVVNLKVDRVAWLANIFKILKPGGTFAVIDHSAETGSGDRDVGTLHRVDERLVVSEVTAAGFELVGTADFLRNPNDTRELRVFDPSIRGKTDCFVLKFRKPTAS